MSAETVDRHRRPEPGPPPRIALPRFDHSTLANGLTLLTVRHDNLPEVSARLVIPAGAADDPPGKSGTGLLTARALTEGTEEKSALEVAQALDYLGASFSLDVKHDAMVVSLSFLSRVFEPAIDLLAEIVALPAFAESEVERLRDERLDEIASGLDEPRVVAGLRLAEAIFGDHPYGTREGGDEESVRGLEPADLRDFHDRFFRPSGATLILVGDLPAAKNVNARIEGAFSGWKGQTASAVSLAVPRPLARRRIWGIHWERPQSELRVGAIGISRLDDEYPAVIVMNSIAGGLFSSRINMNLREDKGWTYGAGSSFDARKLPGPFSVSTAVDARHSIAAVQEMLGELEGMRANPATDEELELARNALTLSMPRLFETVGQVSARVAQQVIYGLADDYWTTYPDEVRRVTAERVGAAAGRYLDTERMAIVVVGPVREFESELRELGSLEFRDRHGKPTTLPD